MGQRPPKWSITEGKTIMPKKSSKNKVGAELNFCDSAVVSAFEM